MVSSEVEIYGLNARERMLHFRSAHTPLERIETAQQYGVLAATVIYY